MLLLISFYQVKDLTVHFYRIIIDVVNNSLIKLLLLIYIILVEVFIFQFLFPPRCTQIFKVPGDCNIIFQCKFYVINIEKENNS